MEVRINEPMTKHTSFRAGGAARWFAVPETVEELTYVLGACKKAGAPWYVLGNGSNLLVSDKGFPGVIISTDRFDRLDVNGTENLVKLLEKDMKVVTIFLRVPKEELEKEGYGDFLILFGNKK